MYKRQVLYSLTQEQLKKTLFPLGGYEKNEIRKIAEENGFINAKKSDSQDICFVKDGDYRSFIETYTGTKFVSGDFVDISTGECVGKHNGMIGYTVGQRKGLGISSEERYYVVQKDIGQNLVYLGREKDLYSTSLIAKNPNFIAIPSLSGPMKVKAKTRYSQKEADAVISPCLLYTSSLKKSL